MRQDKIYVKNWVKAKQVTIFKLSSGVYQAIFQDKSEVIMSTKHQYLLYVDKDGMKHQLLINSNEVHNNRSINARIEYFNKVLRKWIERDANTKNNASSSKSSVFLSSKPRVRPLISLIKLTMNNYI